jgi:hypothetical protein
MKRRDLSPARIEFIRRAAVAAAMRSGRFQASGTARLLVLRKRDVMIAYRTPFNPLPPLSEMAKFLAAREGKTAHLQPYGIDIWQLDIGKVMSLGWRDGGDAIADLYRPGDWENLLGTPRNAQGQFSDLGRSRKVGVSKAR